MDKKDRSGRLYALIGIPRPQRNLFTYLVPPVLSDRVMTGKRVLVPFGNSMLIGICVKVATEAPFEDVPLREIIAVMDKEPVVSEKTLALLLWLSRYYLSPPGITLKSLMPAGFEIRRKKLHHLTEKGNRLLLRLDGSVREDDYERLIARIKEQGLNAENYEWYLDLRKYGSVPHGGFGLGIERTVAWLTNQKHIRQCIPFPRMMDKVYI